MSDRKVSELPSATSIGAADQFYIVQSNTSKKVTASVLFENTANILPSANSVFNLGSPTRQWKSLYVSGNTIFISGVPLTVNNGELVIGSGESAANIATVSYVNAAVANAESIVQPHLELTNSSFIQQAVTLGSPVTITVPNRGTGAVFDVVIMEGEGPYIDSINVDADNRGSNYVVGQKYRIPNYQVGDGSNANSSIEFTVATVGAGGSLLTIEGADFVDVAYNAPGEYNNVSAELRAWIFDDISDGVVLARHGAYGIFNIEYEQEYDNDGHSSPEGTEWNSDGWGTLQGVNTRTYTTWRSALNGQVGNYILDSELVMHDIINDKYYRFDFTAWNGSNGGYSYTRREIIDPNYFSKVPYEGGSSAIDTIIPGVVALARNNNANGIYNDVTEEQWSQNTSPEGTLWNIDGWNDLANLTDRTYDNLYAAFGEGGLGNKIVGTECVMYVPSVEKYYAIKFLDWTQGGAGGGFSYLRYEIDQTKLNEGVRFADGTVQKTAYIPTIVKSTAPRDRRIEEVSGYKQVSVSGVDSSVVWWDKADLPGGGGYFRGAVIDYHAFTNNDSTIIGTIHIVDDDGDDYITHTEVSSGNSDGIHDDLWLVTNEGQIRYRRLDNETQTLKIHWTAKVFYGSETVD